MQINASILIFIVLQTKVELLDLIAYQRQHNKIKQQVAAKNLK
jgi:hypothetical protein